MGSGRESKGREEVGRGGRKWDGESGQGNGREGSTYLPELG